MKKVNDLLDQAEAIVWIEVERLTRRILADDKNAAYTFVVAMGSYCFFDREECPIDQRKWMDKIDRLFTQYNGTFKLTGAGVRWDRDLVTGEITKSTDW